MDIATSIRDYNFVTVADMFDIFPFIWYYNYIISQNCPRGIQAELGDYKQFFCGF